MRSMEAYPRTAMERAMKVQDVMLQAMARKITWIGRRRMIAGMSDAATCGGWRARYRGGAATPGCWTGGGASRQRAPGAGGDGGAGAGACTGTRYVGSERAALSREARGRGTGIEAELQLGEAGAAGSGPWRADASAGRIASGGSGGRCRGCCCTSTAAATAGFRTSAGTT